MVDIIEGIQDIWSTVSGLPDFIMDGLGDLGTSIKNLPSTIAQTVGNVVNPMIEGAVRNVTGAVSSTVTQAWGAAQEDAAEVFARMTAGLDPGIKALAQAGEQISGAASELVGDVQLQVSAAQALAATVGQEALSTVGWAQKVGEGAGKLGSSLAAFAANHKELVTALAAAGGACAVALSPPVQDAIQETLKHRIEEDQAKIRQITGGVAA